MSEPVTDPVEFLRARLDEDEQTAREAAANYDETEWRLTIEGDLVTAQGGVIATGPWEGPILPEGDHIARHDPARVLREVEAGRRMLEIHYDYNGLCPRCFDFSNKPVQREDWPCETVRLLALPYADHEEFREEWRP